MTRPICARALPESAAIIFILVLEKSKMRHAQTATVLGTCQFGQFSLSSILGGCEPRPHQRLWRNWSAEEYVCSFTHNRFARAPVSKPKSSDWGMALNLVNDLLCRSGDGVQVITARLHNLT